MNDLVMGDDIFSAILGELAPAAPASDADSLLAAASAAASTKAPAAPAPAAPQLDLLSQLTAAYTLQVSDERYRREVAERESYKAKGLIGWAVAGLLGAIVVFFLARK